MKKKIILSCIHTNVHTSRQQFNCPKAERFGIILWSFYPLYSPSRDLVACISTSDPENDV